jgi:hypothetical protein
VLASLALSFPRGCHWFGILTRRPDGAQLIFEFGAPTRARVAPACSRAATRSSCRCRRRSLPSHVTGGCRLPGPAFPGHSLESNLNARAAAWPSSGLTGWQWTPAPGSDASRSDSHRTGNGEVMGCPSAEQMYVAFAGVRVPNFSEGNRDV